MSTTTTTTSAKIALPVYHQRPVGSAAPEGGERYYEYWKQLDTQIVESRQRLREIDMALNACNAAREKGDDDLPDVAPARYGLESRRRALARSISMSVADAALLTLIRRMDPSEALPSVHSALEVLRAVGPARFPQSVKVCKAIREQVPLAYERYGDKRSVGREAAQALLLEHALNAFITAEKEQMAFISMLEPCIGTYVATTDDKEVLQRAEESGLFETSATTAAAAPESANATASQE